MGQPLPIDAQLPAALALLEERGALVLSAEPGAGKTTRLPPALLSAVRGEVLVLEPRRLAARMAAARVAAERGESLGDVVGYTVRFERVAGPRTRLRFLTEGVLLRALSEGGALDGVGAVVLDEFHERHLETDLALILLERLRRGPRPDLRLVVMSATLAAGPLAAYLDAPVLEVPGRVFPVEIEHAAGRDDRPLEDRVHAALSDLLERGLSGHTLVFLPGVAEIERCREALAGLARREDLRLLPLHGRLDPAATDEALAPCAARKVLLATNVAESSLTIDGVAAVIDSGLHRQAGTSPWSGLPTLELQPVTQASALQRAHRAGRQGPGRCLRLFTRNDHDRRPAQLIPELLRADLAPALLALRAGGVRRLDDVRWLDEPPAAALGAADRLLTRLGATAPDGALSEVGRELARLPLPPRLGRVLVEARRRGIGALGADAAALLAERDPRRGQEAAGVEGSSDVLHLRDLLEEARRGGFRAGLLRQLRLDPGAIKRVDRVARQLRQGGASASGEDPERTLRLCLLAGHPDRVARRQRGGRDEALVLAEGGSARLGRESVAQEEEWLVVLDATDPRQHGKSARVTLASGIEPDWLLELFPDELVEERSVRWNEAQARVEGSWELRYGGLVVAASSEDGDPAQVAEALARAALAAGAAAFCPPERLEAWQRRLSFARGLDASLPELGEEQVQAALRELCQGRRSFAELRRADLLEALLGGLSWDQRRAVERLAPEEVSLKGGRRLQVHYELRQPPWVTSRLQDFFGMTQGPAVGGGRVPLVLHLQAPNKQSVSVTSDLAGFWERHYPAIRRELSRRYPRHSWPEDPRTAEAPRPGRVR